MSPMEVEVDSCLFYTVLLEMFDWRWSVQWKVNIYICVGLRYVSNQWYVRTKQIFKVQVNESFNIFSLFTKFKYLIQYYKTYYY